MKRMFALYRDPNDAVQATRILATKGITRQHVSALTSTSALGQLFMARYRTATTAIGSTGQRLAGSRPESGALFVGPIERLLTGANIGSLHDALVTLDIPPDDVLAYGQEIRDGAVLLSVDDAAEPHEPSVLDETFSQANARHTQQLRAPTP